MQGNRVGLSVYGAARTWVSPGFGKRHLLRLLDSLAFVKAGPATLPIKYATEAVVSAILPSRSLVILISPMLNDEVVEIVENLAINRYSILCCTPSTKPNRAIVSEPSEIARRIFEAERRLRIFRAEKTARVIQLTPDLSVKAQLKTRSRWVRA